MNVDDFRQSLATHRQEYPLARETEVVILHRRYADDGRQIRRPLAPCDAREMEHGVVVGLRIQPGVIAKGTFTPALARLDIAFEDDVRARRDLEIDADALHHLDST